MDLPQYSIILPTYNEADSIATTLTELLSVLDGWEVEAIVVDDNSPDLTWQVAEGLAERDPRIRVLRRTVEPGLAASVLHGMDNARGNVFAVMDADGQHDPRVLVSMLNKVADGVDVCVASREAPGASYGDFPLWRRLMSKGGLVLTNLVLRTGVSDPLSGFFAVSRRHCEAIRADISPRGFKILLDFLARGNPTVSEVPFTFRLRERGASKLKGATVGSWLKGLRDLRRAGSVDA